MSYKLFSKQYENETLQLSIFLMTCTNAAKRNREMYPECVIASWDALILLLDAENIEWRVQLDAEKNRMYMQITNSRKKQRHTIGKFVFCENNFYKLIDSSVTVYFAVNFQTKAEKPLCFLITFLSR